MANRIRYISSGQDNFVSTKRFTNADGTSYGVTLHYANKGGVGQFIIDSSSADEVPFVGEAKSFKALARRAKRALEAKGVSFSKEVRKKKVVTL
jgi:hypothetical protein